MEYFKEKEKNRFLAEEHFLIEAFQNGLFMTFDLSDLTVAEKQYYLQHIVAPRPIALASTMDKEGNVNLSPFSFFNLFSANPPIVIFSPARRLRDNTTKHSFDNLYEVPEVVINIVSYDMVQQVSLASCEYAKGVDEFIKAGFTKEKPFLVRPPMVKESKAKMECKVIEIKPMGRDGGAGNLVICEVLYLHLHDDLFIHDKKIDQSKLDLVARLGADWYCHVKQETMFTVEKPNVKLGIGFDALPEKIKTSKLLTGNDLAQLASVHELPVSDPSYDGIKVNGQPHQQVQQLLEKGKITEAWQLLLRL